MSNRFALLASGGYTNMSNANVHRQNKKKPQKSPVKGPTWVPGQEKISDVVLEKPVESVEVPDVYCHNDGLDHQRYILAALNGTLEKREHRKSLAWQQENEVLLNRMYAMMVERLGDALPREIFDRWVYRMTTGGSVGYPKPLEKTPIPQPKQESVLVEDSEEESEVSAKPNINDDNDEPYGDIDNIVYDLVVDLRSLGEEFGQRVLSYYQSSAELSILLRCQW